MNHFKEKLEKITVCENMDFGEVIDKYDGQINHTFMLTHHIGKLKAMHSNHDFDRDDHERLCNPTKTNKG